MKMFSAVLRFELCALMRSRAFWVVGSLFGFALFAGAFNARTLHLEQSQAIAEARQSEADWYADLEQRAMRYAQPASEPLPYWQDPTDVSGFSSYFLRAHAAKPHLLLSPLSVGQSDLLPFLLPVSLDTPFGIEPAYDFEAPRRLALGTFDTGFVLVHLLPVAIITLVGLLGTYERDHGLLRLVAMQTATPRSFAGIRVLAIALLFIPLVLLMLGIALAVAGVSLKATLASFSIALVLTAAYAIFWFSAGFAALTLHRSAAGTAGLLTGTWLVLILGLPLGAALLIDTASPAPSRVLYIDTLRCVDDALAAERSALIAQWLAANGRDPAVPAPTYAAEMTIVAPERERKLASVDTARRSHADTQEFWNNTVNMLSPPLAVQQALAQLAGTDGRRHAAFVDATRAYQQQLRDFFYPRVQAEILHARAPVCQGCAGKLQFTDFAAIPRFEFNHNANAGELGEIIDVMMQLLFLSSVLIAAAWVRAREWRAADLG